MCSSCSVDECLCEEIFVNNSGKIFVLAGKRRSKKGTKPQLYEDTSMQPPTSQYGAPPGQGK